MLDLRNVVTRQCALGSSVGVTQMTISLAGYEPQQALRPWAGLSGPTATVNVPVTTIDAVTQPFGSSPPAFIKVDVEGSEGLVLAGATRLLATPDRPIWLLEANPSALAVTGSHIADIGRLLVDYEFWACPLDRPTPALREWRWVREAPLETYNVLCLPLSGRFSRRRLIPPHLIDGVPK